MDAVVHQTVERCGSTRRHPPDRRWPGACRGISIKHARGWRAVGERGIVTRSRPRPRPQPPSPDRRSHCCSATATAQCTTLVRRTSTRSGATSPLPSRRPPNPLRSCRSSYLPPRAASTSPHAASTSPHAASTSPHAVSTSLQSAPVHVGAPAGAKAASIPRDHVTRRTPNSRLPALLHSAGPRRFMFRGAATASRAASVHVPGRDDIFPGRAGSSRSAGRRESRVDPPRPRHPSHGPLRGCRRSYIPPRGVSGCAGAPGRRGSSSSTARATSGRRRPWFIAVCRIKR